MPVSSRPCLTSLPTTVLEGKTKTNGFLRKVSTALVVMSLFKSREWWSIDLNENEMYDSQGLLTVTLTDDKFQSILLGNHNGVLRLFSPNSGSVDGGVLTYEPSHLLLEVQLAHPILQIGEGALVSGSSNMFLAVLHPRLFSVYTMKKTECQKTNVGVQMEIELVYQHTLRHSAHSFVIGPFGGLRGRNFICIQSLDGLLSFYEQESFGFQLYLPTFILPFTFSYLEKIDSFLFLNSSYTFDCYSYAALASAAGSNDKKIFKSWEFNLGDGIIDLNIVTKNGLLILVLSEKNFIGLNEHGKMIFMRRLECKPVAFYSFLTDESKTVMIILATEGGVLNFYETTNLKWSMKIDQIPITIKRIFLRDLPGGLALLSEDGFLQIVYIGTHPSVYLVPPLVQPNIDLQKAELELKDIQMKIVQNDIVDPITADLVSVNLKIGKTVSIQNEIKSCNVMLEICAQCVIGKIQVLFVTEPPLAAANQSAVILNYCDKTFVENSVYVNGSGVVSSLDIQVIVIYKTSEGVVRSVNKNGTLPLELVVSEAPLLKETLHKITLTTNKPVCGMNQLFREIVSDDTSSNAIGLQFPSGSSVTVLAAKSSQKYRLQADSLAQITILLQALLERLKIHFQNDINVTYSGPLPLNDYFEILSVHQELIRKKKNLEEKLSKQTSQFVTIQKKVLSNLKDVTPKSSNLYEILQDTSRLIRNSINEMTDIEKEQISSSSNIRSMSRLMVILLELMSVQKKDLEILRVVFNPNVQDMENQGWLEIQEAAMTFLLRTVLAKSAKDQQKPAEIQLEPITNMSKLTKHFTSVIDRVTKGTYLLERNDFEGKNEPLMTIQAAYESDGSLNDDVVPITSKLLSNNNNNNSKADKLHIQPKTFKEENDLIDVFKEKKEEIEKAYTETLSETSDKQPENPGRNNPEHRLVTQWKESEETDITGDDDENDDGIWDVKVEEMRI